MRPQSYPTYLANLERGVTIASRATLADEAIGLLGQRSDEWRQLPVASLRRLLVQRGLVRCRASERPLLVISIRYQL